MKRALTKQACDVCSRKKRQCSGEKPCQRCKRAGTHCTFSVKAVGRARPTEALGKQGQGHAATKKVPPTTPTAAASVPPPLSVSHATGLQGLQESRFLSVFLEHCAPMYPVADDASIRDGLMHEFVGLANKNSQESLRGPEAMRGKALSCSLFSCIAIGGLMAGCPPAAVAPHMSTAQASLSKFAGLSDVYAVRAYVLYAMASEYLGGMGPGTEYRKGMEAARAVFEKLPAKEKEPVLSAVLSHFMVLEGLPLLQHVETCGPAAGGGGGGSTGLVGGGGGGGGNRNGATARDERNSGTSYVCCKTAHEEATFQKALATRADVSLVMAPHPPPAYVVADAILLTIRFSRDRGDVATRLWHLHDFSTSELARFRHEGKGAVAILAVMSVLIGVKIRLGRLDGMLEATELASSLLQTCPGLVRIFHVHMAHVAMAVYRLYGRREAYDALRELFARTIELETPTFDDIGPDSRLCDLPVCAMHVEKLLKMEPPRTGSGTSTSTSTSSAGGGGGGATSAWSSISSSTGGLTESTVARGGAVPGDVTLSEQNGTQTTGRQQSRRRVEGEFSAGFASPAPSPSPFLFPASPRGQPLLRGSYSAASAGAGVGATATPFPQPELPPPPPVPGWGYADRRPASQALPLPPPSAPRNLLAAPLKTSTPFDGLPQESFDAGPNGGLGMALGAVLGSSPATGGGFFDTSNLAGARTEQEVVGYSKEGVQKPASRGGGGGGGCGRDGEDMTGYAAAVGWAGRNVRNPPRNHRRGGGDGAWEGGARGGAGMVLYPEDAQRGGLEYGNGVGGVPAAASSLPASSAITAADFRGVFYGEGGDGGPGDPPPPVPDL